MAMNVGPKAHAIARKIERLPPEARRKVEALVNSLAERKGRTRRFTFDWEGSLAHLAKKHSSVELQHRTSAGMR